jgi:hypothetical protein
VLKRLFFSFAATLLLFTFISAVRKILFVARTIKSRDGTSQSFVYFNSYNTFKVALSIYICFSKHYAQRPPDLYKAKSRMSSTIFPKLKIIDDSPSLKACTLTAIPQDA